MFTITANGDHVSPNKVEITVDTRADLADLPTTFDVGSTCIVIQDASVFMFGNDKTWQEMGGI